MVCNDEWYTPKHIIDLVRGALGGIELDPASNAVANRTVRAERYFTKDDDGLRQLWRAKTVFCNPPYSAPLLSEFVEKLIGSIRTGEVENAILLVPSHSDTKWWSLAISCAPRMCMVEGRIKFVDTIGHRQSPQTGSVIFYYGNDGTRFEQIFSTIGTVLKPPTAGTATEESKTVHDTPLPRPIEANPLYQKMQIAERTARSIYEKNLMRQLSAARPESAKPRC